MISKDRPRGRPGSPKNGANAARPFSRSDSYPRLQCFIFGSGFVSVSPVLADVPGARNVKSELLPEGVQHLSNVSAGVVVRDPNVAVGVIVEGLATDPKEVGR